MKLSDQRTDTEQVVPQGQYMDDTNARQMAPCISIGLFMFKTRYGIPTASYFAQISYSPLVESCNCRRMWKQTQTNPALSAVQLNENTGFPNSQDEGYLSS